MLSPRAGLLLLTLTATPAFAGDAAPYIVFTEEPLVQGRGIWLATCETCHGYGIAGAPIPMEPDEWALRVQQPISVLYTHAIDGFFGPDDAYMPPRGGNAALSDAQVRLAVDYMVALARHYITEKP